VLLHPDVRPTASFTGRGTELRGMKDALRSGALAAVYGLGSIGKSILVREYAYREQGDYAGTWWLNAVRTKDNKTWEGVEKGLVDPHAKFGIRCQCDVAAVK
jgi:hypothetical protein